MFGIFASGPAGFQVKTPKSILSAALWPPGFCDAGEISRKKAHRRIVEYDEALF